MRAAAVRFLGWAMVGRLWGVWRVVELELALAPVPVAFFLWGMLCIALRLAGANAGEPHLVARWFEISCLIGKKERGAGALFFMAVLGRGKC